MICGKCGKPMRAGEFRMEQHSTDNGIYHSYPMATWFENGTKYCETPQDSTLGYYCTDCGMLIGVFPYTRPVNFIGKFNQNLNENIDILPTKICPECNREIDIDYPRCPYCGFIFEAI